ncbi:MAG: hypothetical protein IPN34_20390 [Planctomycetes bacterium]|nr:hypothetical protein [Planctomycetota bacterium]
MRRLSTCVFALACAVAALAPCLPRARVEVAPRAADFPGWPTELEGDPLEPLPAGASEGAFFRAFGGEVGRFRLGERELVLRWIPSPTRHVHPAHRCFASSGYEVSTPKPVRDAEGQLWSSFEARRGHEHLLVRENLVDADGHSFADHSSWYWSAATGSSRGPWWARTIAVVAQ